MFSRIEPGKCFFDTPLGRCGFSWGRRGVDRLLLPGDDPAALDGALNLIARPPRPAGALIRRITAHLRGRADDLRDVPVDHRGSSDFARRVYRELRKVGPGRTITYGELARRCRRPDAARAVGAAMGANPVPLIVPCHRVLPADGSLGGFSSDGGPRLKARLLFAEGVMTDPRHAAGVEHLRRVDPKLRRVVDRCGPYLPRLGPAGDPYGILVGSIVHQQLSMKAAATIGGRVRALTPGEGFPSPDEVLAIPDEVLRGAGLSFQKISYLRDLASRIADGRLDPRRLRRLDDEAVVARLTEVRGIGRWSAEMFLIFHLDRLDVLPVGDLGLRQGFRDLYGLDAEPSPAELTAAAEVWRPYRSLATWYVWRSIEAGGI